MSFNLSVIRVSRLTILHRDLRTYIQFKSVTMMQRYYFFYCILKFALVYVSVLNIYKTFKRVIIFFSETEIFSLRDIRVYILTIKFR